MHSFEVHSNESTCRESGRLGLDQIYGECFPTYANYFGRPFRLKKSMYGMNNSGKFFSD